MIQFKIGDRVRCIDGVGTNGHDLFAGRQYIVRNIWNSYVYVTHLNGSAASGGWNFSRFELVSHSGQVPVIDSQFHDPTVDGGLTGTTTLSVLPEDATIIEDPYNPHGADAAGRRRIDQPIAREMLRRSQNEEARARNIAALAAELDVSREERLRHPLGHWSGRRSGRRRL